MSNIIADSICMIERTFAQKQKISVVEHRKLGIKRHVFEKEMYQDLTIGWFAIQVKVGR